MSVVENGACFDAREVLELTAEYFGQEVHVLRGPARMQPLIWHRQLGMYAARMIACERVMDVGEAFSRNHRMVSHSVQAVMDRMEVEPESRKEAEAFFEWLKVKKRERLEAKS